jgi:hypothetical protein
VINQELAATDRISRTRSQTGDLGGRTKVFAGNGIGFAVGAASVMPFLKNNCGTRYAAMHIDLQKMGVGITNEQQT